MSIVRGAAFATLLWVGACAERARPSPLGLRDAAYDAAPTADRGAADSGFAADARLGPPCEDTTACEVGTRCLAGRCAPDPCRAAEALCGPTNRCDVRCVAPVEPCAGVRCEAGESCFLGRCVPGCFIAPCRGVQCAAGQFCDPATGACAALRGCDAPCPLGAVCHLDCLPRSACDGVRCQGDAYCDEGRCVTDPCAEVSCPRGWLCTEGRCVETCTCATPCGRFPNEQCVGGRCVCVPDCGAARCGDDDGCGGRCRGPCDDPRQVCDRLATVCVCPQNCTAQSPCGSDDGCGGRCATGCPQGTFCNTASRACECVPACADPSLTACGEPVAERQACPGLDNPCGTGTYCPAGLSCANRRCIGCTPMCPTASVVACGQPLRSCDPDEPCPGRGTLCPPGFQCTDAGCACDARCESVDAQQFPCGSLIANRCPNGPPCGIGTGLCPRGQVCDTNLRRCVGCTPVCPPEAECDQRDGCGGHCVGHCPAGRTCSVNPTDRARFVCAQTTCVGGCPCGQVCANGRCVNRCGEGQRVCNCTTCCLASQYCGANGACLNQPE